MSGLSGIMSDFNGTVEFDLESVNWETVCKLVINENAKLRELVRDYDKVLDAAVYVWGIMADALGYGRKYDALHDRMRELGIEVP